MTIQRTLNMVAIEDKMKTLASAVWGVSVDCVELKYHEEPCFGVSLRVIGGSHGWYWDVFPIRDIPHQVGLELARRAYLKSVADTLDGLTRRIEAITLALSAA